MYPLVKELAADGIPVTKTSMLRIQSHDLPCAQKGTQCQTSHTTPMTPPAPRTPRRPTSGGVA